MSEEKKHYVGEVGAEVIIDCGQSIVGATAVSMIVKKPGGTEVTWTASVYTIGANTNYLRHITVTGDLDKAGTYEAQPVLTLGTWSGKGKTASFVIWEKFS